MLLDEILAMYLFMLSQEVNEAFYTMICTHMILYRECMNEIGWNKRVQAEGIEVKSDYQYCLVNTAEYLPSISNEFISLQDTKN